jgi:hypothetical protein
MRRLFMVWAVAALMAAMLAVMAAPAMAQVFFDNNDFNRGIFFGNNINDGFDNFFGNDGRLRSDIDQDSQSGDVNIGFRVSNSGDYASQCTPAIQQGNTGNFQNASSFVQGGSGTNDGLRDFNGFFFGNDGFFNNRGGIDDFEPGGIDVSFGGSQDVSCPSTIEQSSAASS